LYVDDKGTAKEQYVSEKTGKVVVSVGNKWIFKLQSLKQNTTSYYIVWTMTE
jgi:uncharacterized protein YkuJ